MHPLALRRPDGIVQARQQRAGRKASLQRCRVNERLERRPGLAARLRDAVERAVPEVAAADHRAHFSAVRIEGDERALQRLSLLRRMRDVHRSSSGLAPDIVTAFRDSYNVAIAQALFVENALKR